MLRMKLCKMRGVKSDSHQTGRKDERDIETGTEKDKETGRRREREKGTGTTSKSDSIITRTTGNPN